METAPRLMIRLNDVLTFRTMNGPQQMVVIRIAGGYVDARKQSDTDGMFGFVSMTPKYLRRQLVAVNGVPMESK